MEHVCVLKYLGILVRDLHINAKVSLHKEIFTIDHPRIIFSKEAEVKQVFFKSGSGLLSKTGVLSQPLSKKNQGHWVDIVINLSQ